MSEKKQTPMISKPCKICGIEFQVVNYRAKYKSTCSHECRVKASALGHSTGVTQVTRDCPECGAEFTVAKGQEKNNTTCSVSCGQKVRAKKLIRRVAVMCAICSTEFYSLSSRPRITCSPSCAQESQRRTWASGAGLGDPRVAAAVARRRAKKLNAVPTWYDSSSVYALYKMADQIRRETGRDVHVDHIVPLKSPTVCGLHWSGNMRIIPRVANQSKANRHWPDMP